jgi:hypothetical protein
VVYGFDALPNGEESYVDEAEFTIHGTCGTGGCKAGVDVAFVDLAGSGVAQLIVAASGTNEGDPAGIYRFDTALTGDHSLDDADASLTSSTWFGNHLTAWDSDGDGLAELVTRDASTVYHFGGPWSGPLELSDADAEWQAEDPLDDMGDWMAPASDLDGDGLEDLALGAEIRANGATERAGALYVLHGLLPSGPVADAPLKVYGTETGQAVGAVAVPGDYDGDGEGDLLIGAVGLVPGVRPGELLGYLGPLPAAATLGPADADFGLTGEANFDFFGSHAVPVDADGDARTDVVVAAQSHDGGRGRVYLFLGTALVP